MSNVDFLGWAALMKNAGIIAKNAFEWLSQLWNTPPVTQFQALLFQQIVEVAPTPQVVEPINIPIVLLQCVFPPKKKAKASDIEPANTTETVVEDLCLGRDQGGKGEK